MNTKRIYLFIGLLCISMGLFSQKNDVYLHELQIQHSNYIDTDTARIWITEDIPDLLIFSLDKKEEYFVMEDTLQRDYILLGKKKYLVDSLWLKKYDNYAMAFEYNGSYIISDKKSIYLIVTGGNSFQMGTDEQPLYAIFQKKEDMYVFVSSYYIQNIEDYSEEITNSVKIIFEEDKICLQGINLKQIW